MLRGFLPQGGVVIRRWFCVGHLSDPLGTHWCGRVVCCGWPAPTGLRGSVRRQPGPMAQAGMGRAVGAEGHRRIDAKRSGDLPLRPRSHGASNGSRCRNHASAMRNQTTRNPACSCFQQLRVSKKRSLPETRRLPGCSQLCNSAKEISACAAVPDPFLPIQPARQLQHQPAPAPMPLRFHRRRCSMSGRNWRYWCNLL